MHLSLYRKYRPMTFSDVVGQEHITTILQREVAEGRIHHAYIFTGSRGTGKTTCAKILAKAANCVNPIDGNPCLECDNCRSASEGSMLDIVEIDAASNTGVDNIRDLKEEAMFTPVKGKYRVYIIDETHMLSPGAFNALLKILEEPPEHVIFILATTEVDKVLPTILSRCQRFDFKRLSADDIMGRLEYVAKCEGFTVSEDAAKMIAKIADGGMRDALSIIEQCSVYSKDISVETVMAATGIAGREYIYDMLDAIYDKDIPGAMKIINDLYEGGKDLGKFLNEIAFAFRDVMMLKCSEKCADLLGCMPDEIPRIESYQSRVNMDFILSKLSVLSEGLAGLERSFNAKVYTELLVMRLCSDNVSTAKTVKTVPKPVVSTPVSSEKAKPEAEVKPAVKETNTEAVQSKQNERTVFTRWAEVLEALSHVSPVLANFLVGSSAQTDNTYLYVMTDNDFFHKMIRQENNASLLLSAAAQITGKNYKLKVSQNIDKTAPSPLDSLLKRAESEGVSVKTKEN